MYFPVDFNVCIGLVCQSPRCCFVSTLNAASYTAMKTTFNVVAPCKKNQAAVPRTSDVKIIVRGREYCISDFLYVTLQ